MKKILYLLAAALLAVSFPSCDNEPDDVFSEDASTRIENIISEMNALLLGSENGWVFDYYPGGEARTYGGYAMVMRFYESNDGMKVDVFSEIDPDDVATSRWEWNRHTSAVLTLTTYNKYLHVFGNSEISGTANTYQGDFEFSIMANLCTEDVIVVKGVKWDNKMVLRRVPADMTPQAYIQAVRDLQDELYTSGISKYLVDGAGETYTLIDNASYQSMKYTSGDFTPNNDNLREQIDMPSMAYTVTNEGIRFYEPIIIHGTELYELKWNSVDGSFFSADNENIILRGVDTGAGASLDDAVGSWKLEYRNGDGVVRSKTITVEAIESNERNLLSRKTLPIRIKKLSSFRGLWVTNGQFAPLNGGINIDGQVVEENNSSLNENIGPGVFHFCTANEEGYSVRNMGVISQRVQADEEGGYKVMFLDQTFDDSSYNGFGFFYYELPSADHQNGRNFYLDEDDTMFPVNLDTDTGPVMTKL